MARNTHPKATRERILDAAQLLFAKQGYEHTSIQNILDELKDLSKGAVYHHFKNKQAILDALSERDFAQTRHFFAHIKEDSKLTALEKLRAILRENIENTAHLTITRAALPQLSDPTQLAHNLTYWQTDLAQEFEALIREGNQDGSISCAHPHETASMFSLLSNYWAIQVSTRGEIESRLRYLDEVFTASGLPVFTEELLTQAIEAYSIILSLD